MRKVFLSCVCAVFFLVPLLSQPSLIPSSPESELPQPTISQRLEELAATLDRALTDSQADWDLLSQILTEHSQKLEELAMLSKGSEQEIKFIKKSLKESEILSESLIKDKQALEFRLKMNRLFGIGGTVIGIGIGATIGWTLRVNL